MIEIKCDKCKTIFEDKDYENVVSHGRGPEEDIYKCPNCRKKFKLNFFHKDKDNNCFIPVKQKNSVWKRIKNFMSNILG